jgi:hypothetical protein
MANTFLQIMLDDLEDGIRRKIHNFVVGLVPKPVRKIVGLILIIFGVVAILGFWIAALFWLTDYMEISVIGIIVGISSIGWGIALLRHKG